MKISPPGYLPYLPTDDRWKATVGAWKSSLRRSYREGYTRLETLGFMPAQSGYWSYHSLWTSEWYSPLWDRTVVMGVGPEPELDPGTEIGLLLGVNCHHETVFRLGSGVVEKWEMSPQGILPGVDCIQTARLRMGGNVVWGCEVYWDAISKTDEICEQATGQGFKIVDADLDRYRQVRSDRGDAYAKLEACSGEFWTL